MELIEKIKVMDIIREIASVYSKESEKDNSIALQMALNASYNAVVTIEDAINDIDCVDVAPIVHGRWIYGEDVDIQCSVCGMNAMTNGDYRQEKSNFCPNCGAECWESDLAREILQAEPAVTAACTNCALQGKKGGNNCGQL